MKKILLLLFCSSQIVLGQTIPSTNVTNWKKGGHIGTFPKKIQHINITNYGGNGNGLVNNSPAMAAAISALNNHAGVIEFPAGDFLFNSTIYLPDSVIVRGAGSTSTTFTFNFNNAVGDCFVMSGSPVGSYAHVISGYTKSSKSVKLASTVGYAVGDYIEIRQLNGAWNTNPATWAEYSVGQILKVDSIKNSRLYFHERLRINYDSTLNVEVAKLNPLMSSAVECLKIKRTDGAATSVNYGINMYYAVNCWVSGVEIEKMIGSHIIIYRSSHCEVTGCYLHDAYLYDGSSTHGYGITLGGHACEIKIENNIIRHLRHAIVCKEGANGNTIGYNYTLEPNRSEVPADYGADLLCHGHYAFANLFEGNIVQNIQIDQTWGPSGPWNTFFRNRADGYGILMSSGTVQSDNQNFVGNDVTNTTLFKGNYTLTGSNHYQYGNRIKGTVTPAGTTNLTTTSYYLTTAPLWWTSTVAWPAVGEPYSLATATNPARDRYLSGSNFTVCNARVYRLEDETEDEINTTKQFEIYPNPSTGIFFINSDEDSNGAEIKIYNVFGKLVMQEIYSDKIDLSSLPNDVYFISIQSQDINFQTKIIISK